MPNNAKRTPHRKFKVSDRANVPTGRNGKHKEIVTQILSDLEGLDSGQCLMGYWREWSASCKYTGTYQHVVTRSALALKLCPP